MEAVMVGEEVEVSVMVMEKPLLFWTVDMSVVMKLALVVDMVVGMAADMTHLPYLKAIMTMVAAIMVETQADSVDIVAVSVAAFPLALGVVSVVVAMDMIVI